MILTTHEEKLSISSPRRSWLALDAGKAEKQVKTSQAKHIFKAKFFFLNL